MFATGFWTRLFQMDGEGISFMCLTLRRPYELAITVREGAIENQTHELELNIH